MSDKKQCEYAYYDRPCFTQDGLPALSDDKHCVGCGRSQEQIKYDCIHPEGMRRCNWCGEDNRTDEEKAKSAVDRERMKMHERTSRAGSWQSPRLKVGVVFQVERILEERFVDVILTRSEADVERLRGQLKEYMTQMFMNVMLDQFSVKHHFEQHFDRVWAKTIEEIREGR